MGGVEAGAARPVSTSITGPNRVWQVQLACLGLVAALAIGLWANLPYLLVEHPRLPSWKLAGLYIGDVAALVWFARFAFVHAVLCRPLESAPLRERRRRLWLIGGAAAGAMLLDLGFTVYLMIDEAQAYRSARPTQAEVIGLREIKRPDATWYEFDCRFANAAGMPCQAHLRVEAAHHELPRRLPAQAARVLLSGAKTEKSIPIRYDPEIPARAWVNGLGWDNGNALYWFSLGTVCLQGGLFAIFLLVLISHTVYGVLPWWWDTYKALPLAGEAFCMLAMGLIDRVMDRVMASLG